MDRDLPVRLPRRTGDGARAQHHAEVRGGGAVRSQRRLHSAPEPVASADDAREVRGVPAEDPRGRPARRRQAQLGTFYVVVASCIHNVFPLFMHYFIFLASCCSVFIISSSTLTFSFIYTVLFLAFAFFYSALLYTCIPYLLHFLYLCLAIFFFILPFLH